MHSEPGPAPPGPGFLSRSEQETELHSGPQSQSQKLGKAVGSQSFSNAHKTQDQGVDHRLGGGLGTQEGEGISWGTRLLVRGLAEVGGQQVLLQRQHV